MLEIILILEIFLGLMCLFARKKSIIISALIIVYLFLTFVASQSNMDSYAYSSAFNMIRQGASFSYVDSVGYGIDVGYLILMKFVALITGNYIIFRAVVFVIGMYFIIKSIRIIDNGSITVVVMYLLFPFEYDAFQIEYFLAYSLITYGLVLLIKDVKHCCLKYVVIVIFATSIHKYVMLFFVFLLYKVNISILRKILTAFLLLFIFINVFLRINLVQVAYTLFPVFNKILSFGHYVTGDDLNILTIVMSIMLFLTLYYYSYCIQNKSEGTHNLFMVNSISLMFLPFIFSSLNFERYFRPLLIINYAYINYTANLDNKKLRIIELIIVLMLIFRFTLHWDYYLSMNSDVLQYIFNLNK